MERTSRWLTTAVTMVLAVSVTGTPTTTSAQTPVDLSAWQAQSYPVISGFLPGKWTVAADGNSVTQSVNGQPTMYASDFMAQGTEVTGKIRVNGNPWDDDFIGFALGYNIGDIANPAANYLLVDWKRETQSGDSKEYPTTAKKGLAVSRVTGIPMADEFWGHIDFAGHTGGGLEELARGLTLGNTGWSPNTWYSFRFVFLPDLLEVFVDDVKQVSVSGAFSNGSMAFYNYSQEGVTYSAFTVRQVSTVPEPSTVLLLATGLLATVFVARRRRAN